MKTTAEKQSFRRIRDRVVRAAAERLNRKLFDIDINPGREQNTSVDGFYPGVVVRRRNSDRLEAIMEVETEESIERPGTKDLWARYSRMGVPFYLLVPEGEREKLRSLILNWRPTPLLGTYRVGPDGHVDVNFMA